MGEVQLAAARVCSVEHHVKPALAAFVDGARVRGDDDLDAALIRSYYPARDYAQLHELLKADLAAARTYQVTADMVGTITGACEEAGKQPLFVMESQVPSPAGFVWLDKPVPMCLWAGILVRALC